MTGKRLEKGWKRLEETGRDWKRLEETGEKKYNNSEALTTAQHCTNNFAAIAVLASAMNFTTNWSDRTVSWQNSGSTLNETPSLPSLPSLAPLLSSSLPG